MALPVLTVDGRPPNDLQDFVGDASFVVDLDPPHLVQGTGRSDGTTVRFHEKDVAHSGKDIRVWQVRAGDPGQFLAEHAAQF